MDRRKFLNNLSVTAIASIAGATTLSAKADALQDALEASLEEKFRIKPSHCYIDTGRHFKQPKEGLGFEGNEPAHMWRSVIWPNNLL